MGKKSKKKAGNAGKKNKKSHVAATTHVPNKGNKNEDSDQTSLYKIYKYCTEAVIQWGKATSKKKTKSIHSKSTLSHVIFDILGNLATDGVLMPKPVLDDLKLAISYRKRVGRIYRSLPQVSEDDYARHEWVIQQLEHLAKEFKKNAKERKLADNDATGTAEDEASESVRKGFELLAVSDDEDSLASAEDVQQPLRVRILETPPTAEELEAEERVFAISLLMCDVDDTRASLKSKWRAWALKPEESDTQAGQDLLAVTACTEYALSAVRKSILQVSIEIQSFDDFDQIITGMGESSKSLKLQSEGLEFKKNDLVSVHSLDKRKDLNGRHGFIAGPVDASSHRLPVQLFPTDAYKTAHKKQTISIKPENLIMSDGTHNRLCQIQSALQSFDFDKADIPSPPETTFRTPPSQSVEEAGFNFVMHYERFVTAGEDRDFVSLLQLTIQYALPIWISMARYLPDPGGADAVLNAYIRDFAKTRTIKFPLAFALLLAIDSAIEGFEGGQDHPEMTKELVSKILKKCFNEETYARGIHTLQQNNMKPGALFSHMEMVRHMAGEYSMAGMFFPLVSGEILLSGLRMHFVCGSGFPYAFVGAFTNVLHIYWLLCSEGYLGRIPDLEAIVAIYRQHVFFRGGLAKKGEETYIKCQQLANGLSAQSMRMFDGKSLVGGARSKAATDKALGREGLHVTEISRLLDVLQWSTMAIVNRDTCFHDIEKIAREEYLTIFTAPLLDVSLSLCTLVDMFGLGWIERARDSGLRMMDNYDLRTSKMTPLDRVSFWTMGLGDDRSLIPGEKKEVLEAMASTFAMSFEGKVDDIVANEEPTLEFSAHNHKVDSSLWGEKGARTADRTHI